MDVPWKPNARWEREGSNQETLTSKAPTVLAMGGGCWTLFPDSSMTLQSQGRPEHSTWLTERSSNPISTTIAAVFITSKMKIHLLPKGLWAIKRLEYFYKNKRSHNWKAHGPEGTGILRVHHRHTQVTQHIGAPFPMGAKAGSRGGPPSDTPVTEPATSGSIC